MRIVTSDIQLKTSGHSETVDITSSVEKNLRATGLKEGTANIFSVGSTAGLTTLEFEPGAVKDLTLMFEKLVPENGRYHHEDAWHDGNGYAHVRSALLKTSLSVPFSEGRLILGTWQQIVFLDFDNRPRKRKIVTQFIGE
ncbi:MAG: YjbQ family protein [Candidatus Omnitrophica bacterium]|nr:YjbQ family protein [Candidatus Omnitrophota bacterium]